MEAIRRHGNTAEKRLAAKPAGVRCRVKERMRPGASPAADLLNPKTSVNTTDLPTIMKTHPQRRAGRGFTLIELLVVISIIIVLAAVGFGAAQKAMDRARKVQAQAVVRALEQSIESYISEYSKFPNISANSDEVQTIGESGVELLTILMGKEQTGTSMQNPRQIPFLSGLKEAKGNKGGILYGRGGSGNDIQGLYDPWGKPYRILLDDDFDDEIRDPIKSGTIIRNRKVVVYTLGNDDKAGTADDVKSW